MKAYTLCVMLCFLIILHELFKSKYKNKETYYLADRNLGVLSLTVPLVMTEFNSATLISFSALGYLAGLKALILPGGFLIGLIFYAFAVAKKWKKFNGFSVIDFFTARFGKDIGCIAAVFLLLGMVGFSATYLKSLTILFAELAPDVSYWIISSYLVIIILSIVIKRGIIAIIKTDIISFFIVIFLFSWVLFKSFDLNEVGSNPPIHIHPDLLNNDFLVSLIPLTMFSYILAPWYGQRIFAAKSEKVAILSVFLSAIFIFILYGLGILISHQIAMKGMKFDDPQTSFPYALHLALQGYFPHLGYGAFFLISATTLTGVWNSIANIISDLVSRSGERNNKIVFITIICYFSSYLISNIFVENILNKMILANIPVVALSFALLAGFYRPRVTKAGVYASILTGLVSGIFSYVCYGDEGIYTYYWAFFGIPLIFISGILTSLLFPGTKTRADDGEREKLNGHCIYPESHNLTPKIIIHLSKDATL